MKLNPSFEHYLFDDEECRDFIKEKFDSDTLRAYDMLNVGAAKADLWRYAILFERGGIYLDLDSEIIANVDPLITNYGAVISRERHQDKFVQWCLMFESKHEILKKTIEKCVFNILTKKRATFFI